MSNALQQEMFDTMLDHLRKQGTPAILAAQCMYRSPAGNKCAVGALIPDHLYSPAMEGGSPDDISDIIGWDEETTEFLKEAQISLHDRPARTTSDDKMFMGLVEMNARILAEEYDLDYKEPDHG